MSWEERLLFLMFLDYKGALKKWEKNHNEDKGGFYKIEHNNFTSIGGFDWALSSEGDTYWSLIEKQWENRDKKSITVPSLDYGIYLEPALKRIKIGCQSITKEDALNIADFIYDCFGE